MGLIYLVYERQREVLVACGCGDEHSGSIKCGKFLDELKICYLLKKDSAPLIHLLNSYH